MSGSAKSALCLTSLLLAKSLALSSCECRVFCKKMVAGDPGGRPGQRKAGLNTSLGAGQSSALWKLFLLLFPLVHLQWWSCRHKQGFAVVTDT